MRIHKNTIILSKEETKRWYGLDLCGNALPAGPDGNLHSLGRAMGQALANFRKESTYILPFDRKKVVRNVSLDCFDPQ